MDTNIQFTAVINLIKDRSDLACKAIHLTPNKKHVAPVIKLKGVSKCYTPPLDFCQEDQDSIQILMQMSLSDIKIPLIKQHTNTIKIHVYQTAYRLTPSNELTRHI